MTMLAVHVSSPFVVLADALDAVVAVPSPLLADWGGEGVERIG